MRACAALVHADHKRCNDLGSDEEPEQGAERRGRGPRGRAPEVISRRGNAEIA
jgi:hypothetical protein